jgi:ubiquitin C-terminal hydrolase|tara:strand:+ start:1914 stop:2168 length:255 start_codon:yes stop_codon:yes gene_type:complete
VKLEKIVQKIANFMSDDARGVSRRAIKQVIKGLEEKQLKLEAHSIDLELSEEERQNAREKLAIVKVQQEKAVQLLSNKNNNSTD